MPSCARAFRLALLLVSSLAHLAVAGLASTASGQVLVKREAPVSLTGSDGAGLELVSYQATAVVQEPLAFTELHLVFRNPEARVREGRFRIALPAGAAVSRFAMKLDTFWQEGEVVERQAARAAYEDALHRRQDPALLENDAGNEFAARVFPIPPGATKELIVSYSEELGTSGVPYRLALQGLPRMASLEVRVLVGSAETGRARSNLGGTSIKQEVVELQKTAFKPDRDFELPRSAIGPVGLRDGNAVVARITPLGQAGNTAGNSAGNTVGKTAGLVPLTSLQILVDTSASRALGFDEELARLRAVLAALAKGGDFPVTVTAFDQEVVKLWSGSASAYPASVDEKLRARQALGASHLEAALAALSGKGRVLLVTDGIVTAGATQGDELRLAVQKLGARGMDRLDVLPVGGLRDDELLRGLVTAGLPHAGRVLSSDESPEQLAQRMRQETSGDLAISVEGATWFWPTHVQGLQPGDDVVVYADLPGNKPLRVMIGGRAPATLPTVFASAARPLLLRALAQARLARLSEQRDTLAAGDRDLRDALRRQMVELSVKNRVLCRETALVVLESDNDYARFGINRQALAEILTVGLKGIEVLRRTAPVVAPVRTPDRNTLRESLAKSKAPLRQLAASADEGAADPAAVRAPAGTPPSAPEPAPQAAFQDERSEGSLDGLAAGKPTSSASAIAGGAAPAPPPPAPVRAAAAPPRGASAEIAESKIAESESAAPPSSSHASAARSLRRDGMVRERNNVLDNANANEVKGAPAWEGPFAEVMTLVKRGATGAALDRAWAWRRSAPGDVLALVALGEALEQAKQPAQAARAYGSIIDLFPGRADLRRFAGGHLERLQGKLGKAAIELAIDSFRKAAADRPDHPSSHRLLAFALLKGGHAEEAFEALVNGLHQHYPDGRFLGAVRILQEDLGLVAAVWAAQAPGEKAHILSRLHDAGGVEESEPSVRFVLTWETDANDVDFHIKDGKGGHAFYSQPTLPSGGELYADVTTGYGPECFTVRHPENARAYPYVLQAHYYSRGPMGYGMGKLQILNHDGRGHIRFDDRPFVVMVDNAFVDLGRLDK